MTADRLIANCPQLKSNLREEGCVETVQAIKDFAMAAYLFAEAATKRSEAEWMSPQVQADVATASVGLMTKAEKIGLEWAKSIVSEQEQVFTALQYQYVHDVIG